MAKLHAEERMRQVEQLLHERLGRPGNRVGALQGLEKGKVDIAQPILPCLGILIDKGERFQGLQNPLDGRRAESQVCTEFSDAPVGSFRLKRLQNLERLFYGVMRRLWLFHAIEHRFRILVI